MKIAHKNLSMREAIRLAGVLGVSTEKVHRTGEVRFGHPTWGTRLTMNARRHDAGPKLSGRLRKLQEPFLAAFGEERLARELERQAKLSTTNDLVLVPETNTPMSSSTPQAEPLRISKMEWLAVVRGACAQLNLRTSNIPGLGKSSFSNWETRGSSPTDETVEHVRKSLALSANELPYVTGAKPFSGRSKYHVPLAARGGAGRVEPSRPAAPARAAASLGRDPVPALIRMVVGLGTRDRKRFIRLLSDIYEGE